MLDNATRNTYYSILRGILMGPCIPEPDEMLVFGKT